MNEKIRLREEDSSFFRDKVPEAVKQNKKLILLVVIIFSISIAGTFVLQARGPNRVANYIEEQTEPFQEVLERETEEERTTLEWIGFFVRNNLNASLQTIGLGTIFGIFSFFSLLLNGALIGHVTAQVELGLGPTLSLLLPHGVFELTGYLLAVTCGVKLGLSSFESLRNQNVQPLKKAGAQIKYILPAIILLILIAAVVEGFLGTYRNIIITNSNVQIGLISFSIVAFSIILVWLSGKFGKN